MPIRVYWECGGFDGLLYEALGLELFFFPLFCDLWGKKPSVCFVRGVRERDGGAAHVC